VTGTEPSAATDLDLVRLAQAGDVEAFGELVERNRRAVLIDAPIGKGHVVMFASRPFWRWQTQGNFFLGFNAILNWNDLDAGRTTPKPVGTGAQEP